MSKLVQEIKWEGTAVTLSDLRAFVEATSHLPGPQQVHVRTSHDQRDGDHTWLTVQFNGSTKPGLERVQAKGSLLRPTPGPDFDDPDFTNSP